MDEYVRADQNSMASFARLDSRGGRPYMNQLHYFASSIHEKEECGQADRKERHADHPNLIPKQRRNLLCREEHQSDSQQRRKQSAHTRDEQRSTAVLTLWRCFLHCELDQSSEHVYERHQLQHHSKREQFLKCLLHSRNKEVQND